MNRSFSKIRHIQESNMRLEKRLILEQSNAKPQDGHYLGSGSSDKYQLNDMSNVDTGFRVKATIGIRGFKENDPVIVVGGIPISDTWGEGGEVTFQNVNWSGTIEPLTPVITPQSITNNSIPQIIIDSPPPTMNINEGKGNFVVENKMYQLDISSFSTMSFSGVKLATDTIEKLLELFQKKLPDGYTKISSNYKPQSQFINIYKTYIYVGKDGKPLLYERP